MQDLRSEISLEQTAKEALIANTNHIKFNDENYTITQNLIEKEIAKEMPKDFDDVFIVAKSMLNPHPNESEIRRTVREIKAKYPNLFIDMNEYFKSVMDFDD